MKLPFPTLRVVLSDTGRVLDRFPFVVLAAAVGTATAIMGIEAETPVETRLAMASALGLPLLFALRLLRERLHAPRVRGLAMEAAGILLLAGFALSIPADFKTRPEIVWQRFIALNIGLHFSVACVPALTGAGEREFWQFNRRLFQRFALSVLYTVVLFAGFTIAIASADKLFGLHVRGNRYAELWVLMVGLFNTVFFLGGVPADRDELMRDESYPRGLRAFAQFALAPLVIVFVSILYLYALKIIRAWAWPHGWVALPVCCLAVVGILSALLLQPARTMEGERWAQWYWRNFFRALAPLSILLLLSLYERATAYGMTESRYFGFVIGTWLLAVSVYFTLRPGGSTRLIPASLALLCFLSAAGPWSAFSVSAASQKHRLIALLQPYGAIVNGRLVPIRGGLTPKDKDSTTSILTLLLENYGSARFADLFSGYYAEAKGSARRNLDDQATYLGVQSVLAYVEGTQAAAAAAAAASPRAVPHPEGYVSVHINLEGGLPVAGYRSVYHACVCPGGGAQQLGALSVEFLAGDKAPKISFRGTPLDVAAVEARLAAVVAAGARNRRKLPPAEMAAKLVSGDREWLLVFDTVEALPKKGARAELRELEIYLLEK